MPHALATSDRTAAMFAVYVAAVLTVAMLLFPPFTSFNGTEYAFVLTGPEWARALDAGGHDLGFDARLYWPLLLIQIGTVWAIALGARQFLVTPRSKLRRLDDASS